MPALIWLLLITPPLLLLERWIHRHLQGVILLTVRSPEIALMLYSLIFFPGVLLHELSHWLMATLLGVRTGRFSVWPEKQKDGSLRLGYVETAKVDFLREAVIGAAPLLAGVAVVSFAAYSRLGAGPVGEAMAVGDLVGALEGLWTITRMPDALLWIYLLFSVSNAMMPSGSDRRAWPMLAAAVLLSTGLLVYAGFGQLLEQALAAPLDLVLRALAGAFSITVALDLLMVPIVAAVEGLVTKVTGLRVEY